MPRIHRKLDGECAIGLLDAGMSTQVARIVGSSSQLYTIFEHDFEHYVLLTYHVADAHELRRLVKTGISR